ncbi:MAG: formate--tetrahydrofolate ligase, partial [Spirochaetaceae bacterium]|nr:formate--tetrahydrofolate ligase [Spirochaetaceae bacterium]
PFANIAHGCNSINATKCALATGDYVVTEAGFAADLGAEKFFDIKCRIAGLKPSAVVIVATIRALKMHGGVALADLSKPDVEALDKGSANLLAHIQNLGKFGVPVVVALNRFTSDTEEEIAFLQDKLKTLNIDCVLNEGWAKGGEGAVPLAEAVVKLCETKSDFKFLYESDLSLKEKIEKLATEIYRADRVDFSSVALKKLEKFQLEGYGNLPVCVAKTQNSISHDKNWRGLPENYAFPVRDVQLYAGAGFIVVLAGDIMTMPGLPKKPAACEIDVDDDGVISGLF